mmetsp:Transcript_65184/g.103257  ORF Transcript_65184/g.103257 Transcript_65184/m.103257 type:complete len:654 (+) Transcript_65184:64-2025(+)
MALALRAKDVKNSLYVRNLSPNVTESVLREVFSQVDDIVDVTFRAFPNSNNQFFAQIDFVSSKGVAQGSRLNGTPIMGAACQVGVIDPLAQKVHQDMETQKFKAHKLGLELPGSATASASSAEDAAQAAKLSQEEYVRKQKEAMEDQNYRTVHMTGFDPGVSNEALKAFCEHFGEVVSCRVEEPESISPFALVEFKERGPASVVKTQKTYEVDGRIVSFTEAKTMVDASGFAEQSVHFQLPIYDYMAMKQVLATQGNLNAKLAKVREAAMSMKIGQSDSTKDADTGADKSAPSMAAIDKELKKDKVKKDKKRDRSRPTKDDRRQKDEKMDKKDRKRRKEASKSRSISKPRNDAREKAFTKDFLEEYRRKKRDKDASSEQGSPKKKKKKKKEKKEKEESADDDASAKTPEAKKKDKDQKKQKKKEDATQKKKTASDKKKEASEEALEKKKKKADAKKKKPKMALEMEDDEAPASEEKAAPEDEAVEKEASDDESSSAPIDLDDPDGVDFVYGAEKVALSSASASSSSSSSSKSSVNPEELEITGIDHGLDIVATDIALEVIAQKTNPVDLSDRNDAVEFVKTLPLGSPAVTTPGDISSTDSSSDSSDSPVREVAGEVSDGEGTTSAAKKRPPLPPVRRRPPVMRGCGRGGRGGR